MTEKYVTVILSQPTKLERIVGNPGNRASPGGRED
jgi:hypothetical protein